jgi:uncharacterized protein (DUF4415 family)
VRIDAGVLAFFQAQGPGYPTRISNVPRDCMLKELRRSQAGRA